MWDDDRHFAWARHGGHFCSCERPRVSLLGRVVNEALERLAPRGALISDIYSRDFRCEEPWCTAWRRRPLRQVAQRFFRAWRDRA